MYAVSYSLFLPPVYTLSWTKSFQMLFWKEHECNSDEVNVSQGWMLFSLKLLAVAALAGVRWELKHNQETQDELNKDQAGG